MSDVRIITPLWRLLVPVPLLYNTTNRRTTPINIEQKIKKKKERTIANGPKREIVSIPDFSCLKIKNIIFTRRSLDHTQ